MRALTDAIGADRLRQYLPLATLVVLVVLVGVAEPSFLEPATLLQLAADTAVLFILATGVTFVIMLGGIDLSLQSMASLSSVVVALTIARLGYGAFVLAVAIGAIAGLLSGLAPVRFNIPSFRPTLPMAAAPFGAALLLPRRSRLAVSVQLLVVLGYPLGLTLGLPGLWADPFGALLKNIPILALIAVNAVLSAAR